MSGSIQRENPYNANVSQIRLINSGLMVMRVVPDERIADFLPGQYATLGLGNWEPRCDAELASQEERNLPDRGLIRRAYSISCPVLNESNELVTCADLDFLEFYIALVNLSDEERPRLTPRLFRLHEGSRIYVSPHIHGTYTLESCRPSDTILFLATGTGEAPHNAMIAQLLRQGHTGKILSAVCVRHRSDLGYLGMHRELECRYKNYRYITLTTREPENLDRSHPRYVGKQYLQDYLRLGKFEQILDAPLRPEGTHVYLCGNPDMIGLPQSGPAGEVRRPPAGGMVDLLTGLGFCLDHPHERGNIHVEKYW